MEAAVGTTTNIPKVVFLVRQLMERGAKYGWGLPMEALIVRNSGK